MRENVRLRRKKEGHALATSYQRKSNKEQRDEVREALEACVREGARKMLAAALEEEVNAFLGRNRYQRASETTRRLFARLYLEGLATGDFEPVFRELVGETTALSPNAIVRLKERWEQEYEAWRKRPLWEHRYPYVWSDGVYLDAGTEVEKTALLCVVGAREDGEKELLGMDPGYRESTESWAETLRDLRNRGLEAPLVATGDGALGLWAALDEVYPTTEHQRCWNHRITNVQAKLPERQQAEARRRLRDMAEAPTRKECEELRDRYVAYLLVAD